MPTRRHKYHGWNSHTIYIIDRAVREVRAHNPRVTTQDLYKRVYDEVGSHLPRSHMPSMENMTKYIAHSLETKSHKYTAREPAKERMFNVGTGWHNNLPEHLRSTRER
jgi:hypothetical protein